VVGLARSVIEERLVALWERILEVAPLDINDSWAELGGDSLAALVVLAEIEGQFGAKLPLDTLAGADTIAKLAALIKEQRLSDAPAVLFNQDGQLPVLHVVHGLSGSTPFARRLAKHLRVDQPVLGFQAPHLVGGSSQTIHTLAARYLRVLTAHQPRGPYQLVGWCVGSIIALELALLLTADGEQVAPLILVDPPVRPVAESGTVEQYLRFLKSAEIPEPTRDRWMKNAIAMTDMLQRHRPTLYRGDLDILCSRPTYEWLRTQKSQWRSFCSGRLTVRCVGQTHDSVVGENMPRLVTEIEGLIASQEGRGFA